MIKEPSIRPALLLLAVLLVLLAIGGYIVNKSQTFDFPAQPQPKASATKRLVHCPVVSGFKPNMMTKVAGYAAQTVLDKDGCPAILVLIPITTGVPH